MTLDSEPYLYLSNDFIFYTIEGEGKYAGYPSVFMRLAMCNLTCIGFKSAAAPFGCDSYTSWSVKNKKTFQEIFTLLEDQKLIEHLAEGALLKITGGEPLIQQNKLIALIDLFTSKYGFTPKIDFETNGTIMPDPYWKKVGATFTVSPKLSNNGDPRERRYKPDVLQYHAANQECFKFVISSGVQINEIESDFISSPRIKLRPGNVWIMPCCGSRDEQVAASPMVADLCKTHHFKFSPRLHLMIWDKALLV